MPPNPLSIAAGRGDVDEIRRLLKAGADPNMGEYPGDVINTPLIAVATGDGNGGGCYECARLLLDAGADPNIGLSKWSPGFRVGVPLETAANKLNARMMRILVEGGAKMPKGWKWLQVPVAAPYQLKAQGFPNTPEGRKQLIELVQEYAQGKLPSLPDPTEQLYAQRAASKVELQKAEKDPDLTTGFPPSRHSAEGRLATAKATLKEIEDRFPLGALSIPPPPTPAPAAAALGGKSRRRRLRRRQTRKPKRSSSKYM